MVESRREWATVADFRAELHAWLDAHRDELAPRYAAPGTLDEQIAQMQRVKSILFDAGWMRYGWPEARRRTRRLADAAHRARRRAGGRDLTDPGLFSLIEVLAPTLIDFAPPELAADVVPACSRAPRCGARGSRNRGRAATSRR